MTHDRDLYSFESDTFDWHHITLRVYIIKDVLHLSTAADVLLVAGYLLRSF